MLNQNRNAVYFLDIYASFSDDNKKIFNELFKEAINNCSKKNIRNFFSSINIENNDLKINNFDKSLGAVLDN